MKTKTQFNGRHYETGSIHNALAVQGVKASHTGKPYSEALLLGISGGIAFGYFTFEYKGYLPHVAMLPRNTFSSFTTILERLGIAQDIQQTNKAEIAEKNLVNVLESGLHPLVWADQFSLPYNDLKPDDAMWGMIPILAVETDGKSVAVVDRSVQPLQLSMAELTKARGPGQRRQVSDHDSRHASDDQGACCRPQGHLPSDQSLHRRATQRRTR
jgi:hypothetical protein